MPLLGHRIRGAMPCFCGHFLGFMQHVRVIPRSRVAALLSLSAGLVWFFMAPLGGMLAIFAAEEAGQYFTRCFHVRFVAVW